MQPQRYSISTLLIAISTLVMADAAATTHEWPAYGGAPGGGHYSAATQIAAGNVNQLGLAWSHRSGDFVAGSQGLDEEMTAEAMLNRPTNFVVTPIMVRDTLYYCTPFNRVFALDPATGAQRWVYDPGVDMNKETITNCRGVSSWIDPKPTQEFCSHRIITGTLDARLIALDGATGKPCDCRSKDSECDGDFDPSYSW